VDEGVKLKRGEPKGFGSVSPIEKKTSHVTIILDERVPGMKRDPKREAKEAKQEHEHEKAEEKAVPEKKQFGKKDIQESQPKAKAGGLRNLGKRFFRRKAI
jgi:hypothetical protein